MAGGIFVDHAARALFERNLRSSKFADNANLDYMEIELKERVSCSSYGIDPHLPLLTPDRLHTILMARKTLWVRGPGALMKTTITTPLKAGS
jgi:hypothetical protein